MRFLAHRAVVVVRNPFDSLLSYFHLGMTNTHDMSLSDEVTALVYADDIYPGYAALIHGHIRSVGI
jgi:hypothetical protein